MVEWRRAGDVDELVSVFGSGAPAGPACYLQALSPHRRKRATKEAYVWKPGMPDWRLLESVLEVLGLVSLAPPPVPNEVSGGGSR